MPYPYPELRSIIQLKCAPKEYQRVITRFTKADGRIMDERLVEPVYQFLLPDVTYARCPICGHILKCRVDIYSLQGWAVGPEFDQSLYPDGYQAADFRAKTFVSMPDDFPPRITPKDVFDGVQKFAHCEHFLGVHKFLNLHGALPPFNYFINYGEVPYVEPWILESSIPGFSILHALPVCKIENDDFLPAYTIFSLTYFCPNRASLFDEWREDAKKSMNSDPEYYPGLISPGYFFKERNRIHDLAYFANIGRLGFLDFTQPQSPLIIGKGVSLPIIFNHIEGRSYFEWENGEFKNHFEGAIIK